jgi:hypothetical protein
MSGHKDRVSALATTTLDLARKLDTVISTQAEHGAAIASLNEGQAKIVETMNANHLDLNAKLNLILSKLG